MTWFLKGLDLRSDTVVIVDVPRFSTTVSIALQIGFKSIYVFPKLSDAVNSGEGGLQERHQALQGHSVRRAGPRKEPLPEA